MMKLIQILFACLIMIAPISQLLAGEIYPYGKGLFAVDEEDIEISASENERLFLIAASSLSGKIKIEAKNENRALFEYRKILKTKKHPKAVDYAEKIVARLQRTPEGLKLILQAPNPAPWSGSNESARIEGVLFLPPDCYLEIEADYMDLDIIGPFRSVENEKSFGKVEIENVLEKLNLNCSGRDAFLENIRGDININISNADIRVEKVLIDKSSIRIRNENGDVSINNCHGDLDIKNSYGRIKCSEVFLDNASVTIAGNYCPVKLEIEQMDSASLQINSSYENVNLTLPQDIDSDYILHTENDGEIHVNNIAVIPTQSYSNRLELRSGKGLSNISVMVEGGADIDIRGKR